MRSLTIRRLGLWLVAVAAGLVLLWIVLGFILGTSRGLDLTDEGLYLLAADPPNASAAWGFPFGWHTHPLFVAVGYDIASFRTLGALILVLTSAWLGWLVAKAVRPYDLDSPAPWPLAFRCGTAVVAGLGSLLYYVSMLRAPSYNWLCLVGITLASAGLLMAIRQADRATPARSWLQGVVPGAVSSLALFVTLPAKPSVLPMVLLLGLGLLQLLAGWSTAWRWCAWAIGLLPVWVALAVVTTFWPRDFVAVLARALQMPIPDPSQTPVVAIQEALLAPRAAASAIGDLPDGPAILMLGGSLILLLPVIARRRWLVLRVLGYLLVTVAALAIAGVPVPLVNTEGRPFGLAQPTLTTALLAVLLATRALTWGLDRQTSYSPTLARSPRTQLSLALALFLTMLTLVFGFGSDNGIYGQAALAGGLILSAAASVALAAKERRDATVALLAVMLATVLFVGAGLVGGWRFPQRQAPLLEQTINTEVGAQGATLQLDPNTAQMLAGLRQQATAMGWHAGTPLVDVSYTWNPGVAYALGARVPDSLLLTIFGYGAAHDITDFHLTGTYLDFPFDQAWILTTRPDQLDQGARGAVDFTLDKLDAVSGRSFPASYECISSGDFVLWRPITEPAANPSSCGW